MMNATKRFIVSTLIYVLSPFMILLGLIPQQRVLDKVCVVLVAISILIVNIIARYRAWKDFETLVKATIYTEVDQMIHSNDYQTASLNNEMLINKLNDCTHTNGSIEYFIKSELNHALMMAICCGMMTIIFFAV